MTSGNARHGSGRFLLWTLLMLPNAAAWLVAPHPLIKASSKTFFHFSTHHHKTARVSGPWVRMGTEISRGEYAYGSFNCAFRKKAASAGRENEMPLLLVHPAKILKSECPSVFTNSSPLLREFLPGGHRPVVVVLGQVPGRMERRRSFRARLDRVRRQRTMAAGG